MIRAHSGGSSRPALRRRCRVAREMPIDGANRSSGRSSHAASAELSTRARRSIEIPMHHRDPSDRLPIAQAILEGAAVVSRDEQLAACNVRRIW